MIQSSQFNHTKVFMFGLLISATALLTSCAPKHGCYFGMLNKPTHTTETCETDLVEKDKTTIETMAIN